MTAPKPRHQHLLAFFFILSVFLLNIFRIKETDAWMHLSIGKVLWQLKGLPLKEPMVYSTPGAPFYYSSWLFGVVYYLLYEAFSTYGVILFKALTVACAFYILLKDSVGRQKNYAVAVSVLTGVAYLSGYRFVERPDTLLMVFIASNIYFLNAFVRDDRKYLYLLPVIDMVWANCHSSVNLILVIFPAFIAGGCVQYWLGKRGVKSEEAPTLRQLKIVSVVFAATVLASLINPFFIKQYLYGAEVLSSPWAARNIIELQKPIWPVDIYPFIIPLIVLFTFLLNLRSLSLIHILLVIPFLVLPFTARRFLFLAAIVSGPIVARNISAFLKRKSWDAVFMKGAASALVGAGVLCFALFTLYVEGTENAENKVFGFGINYGVVPEGALRFMDSRDIGGRVFNVVGFGGYINWRDYPARTVFVDPRFHLPGELLEKMDLARQRPEVLDELERTYRFESVIGAYPFLVRTSVLDDVFQEGDVFLSHAGWSLVYWDDNSLLYVKKEGRYGSVASEAGYMLIKPANFSAFNRGRLYDEAYRNGLIEELKRNIRETGSLRGLRLLGLLYNRIGAYPEAFDILSRALTMPGGRTPDIYAGAAYALQQLGRANEAAELYRKSVEMKEDPTVLYRLALCYIESDKNTALMCLKRALRLNPYLSSAFRAFVSACRELGLEDEITSMTEIYRGAGDAQRKEEHFRRAQDAYDSGRFDVAITEFEQAARANPLNPRLLSSLGSVFYDLGMLEKAYEYQSMAIDIDPGHAEAHYGLALISEKRGDDNMAKEQLDLYLGSDPEGRFADRARERLNGLTAPPAR